MLRFDWIPEKMCPEELTEGRENVWFYEMWDALWKRGLTSYSTELESAIVKARAVTIHLLLSEFDYHVHGRVGEDHRPLETDLLTVKEAKMLYRHFSPNAALSKHAELTDLLSPAIEALRTEVVGVFIDEFGMTKWTALTYFLFDMPNDPGPDGRSPMTIEEFDERYWDYLQKGWIQQLRNAKHGKSEGAKRAIRWVRQGCPRVNPSYAF